MPNQWQWFAIAGVCSLLSVQAVLADEGTSQTKGAEEILLKPSSHISPLDEQKKPCTARVVQSAECKLILETKAQPDEAALLVGTFNSLFCWQSAEQLTAEQLAPMFERTRSSRF